MPEEPRSGPAFNDAAPQNSRAIFQTEQGRQEAAAISRKAEAIIERRELARDQNRNAWVANKAMQIAKERDQPGGIKDGPPPPPGSVTRTPFQEAEQEFATYRAQVAKRVNEAKKVMLDRPPSQNRIRGFQAVTKVLTPEERAQQSQQTQGGGSTEGKLSYAERLKQRAEAYNERQDEAGNSQGRDKSKDRGMDFEG